MKLATLLTSAGGLAVGYVLGSAAGRGRYAQITAAARDLVRHTQLLQAVFDLADKAKTNAHRFPGPTQGLVTDAATRLEDRLTTPRRSHAPSTDTSTDADPGGAATDAPTGRPVPPLA